MIKVRRHFLRWVSFKFIEADLKGAEQLLLKSLALNPLNSEGYHYYAHLLGAQRDLIKQLR